MTDTPEDVARQWRKAQGFRDPHPNRVTPDTMTMGEVREIHGEPWHTSPLPGCGEGAVIETEERGGKVVRHEWRGGGAYGSGWYDNDGNCWPSGCACDVYGPTRWRWVTRLREEGSEDVQAGGLGMTDEEIRAAYPAAVAIGRIASALGVDAEPETVVREVEARAIEWALRERDAKHVWRLAESLCRSGSDLKFIGDWMVPGEHVCAKMPEALRRLVRERDDARAELASVREAMRTMGGIRDTLIGQLDAERKAHAETREREGSVQIETFEWLLRRGPDEPAHRLVAEDPESLRKRIALLESTCETLRDEMKRATAAIDAVVERGLR